MKDIYVRPYPLYLLRHGETDWNHQGRIQGSKNSPLTGLGLAQAQKQAAILKFAISDLSRHALFVSPLGRARTTAGIALGRFEAKVDPRLRELDCGAWEGLTPAERATRDPELVASCKTDFDLYRNAPGGEGLQALEARLRSFLNDLNGPSVIVAHKVVLIVMRGLLLGHPPATWEQMSAPQGVVIQIEQGAETILRS